MTAPSDTPRPLPLAEPQGSRRVWCAMCQRPLVGRLARRRGYGDDCWAKLQQRTAPTPPRREVDQETLPGCE